MSDLVSDLLAPLLGGDGPDFRGALPPPAIRQQAQSRDRFAAQAQARDRVAAQRRQGSSGTRPATGYTGEVQCGGLTNSFVAVPQDQYYAVESFGKFKRMLPPGLNWTGLDLLGWCITFRSITSRVEQSICSVHTKTKDNVFLEVKVAVQQSVDPDNVRDALYKLTCVHAQIDSYVADVVRSFLPTVTLDEAFEKKDTLSHEVQEKLIYEMADFGFLIHKALVIELVPDASVVAAMNEINKQKRLRDAAIMAADADKIRVVKAAEAEAEAAQLHGEGIARQRSAVITGLRESFEQGPGGVKLTPDKISELLLMTQYFETLSEVADKCEGQTVFLNASVDAIADVKAEVRQGINRPSQVVM